MMTIRMPISAFDGVAVRMTPVGTDGDIEVAVELMHSDPGLSLPLMIADDPADVAADWQAWGDALQLPLLLAGADGTIVEAGGQDEKPASIRPKPRRRHSFFADRRPRFLTRRKTGRSGPLERVNGREIIAPE